MPGSARVEVEALKTFRAVLFKFQEVANSALSGAEGEMQRVAHWLENEQLGHWQSEIRKATEAVARAKEAVRMKQLFKDSTGKPPSAIDEKKALAIAIKRQEHAEQKFVATKQHTKKLQREIQVYKGTVQRFATAVQIDIPAAAARLGNLLTVLETYVSTDAPAALATSQVSDSGGGVTEGGATMARAAAEEVRPPQITAADLRRKAPTQKQREQAMSEPLALTPWRIAPLADAQQDLLKSIEETRNSPRSEDKIVIAAGAWAAPRIYFERLTPTGAGDSGWYVKNVDGVDPEEWQSTTIAELTAHRPDLDALLSLPTTWIVVIGSGGIEHLFDVADMDRCPIPSTQEEKA